MAAAPSLASTATSSRNTLSTSFALSGSFGGTGLISRHTRYRPSTVLPNFLQSSTVRVGRGGHISNWLPFGSLKPSLMAAASCGWVSSASFFGHGRPNRWIHWSRSAMPNTLAPAFSEVVSSSHPFPSAAGCSRAPLTRSAVTTQFGRTTSSSHAPVASRSSIVTGSTTPSAIGTTRLSSGGSPTSMLIVQPSSSGRRCSACAARSSGPHKVTTWRGPPAADRPNASPSAKHATTWRMRAATAISSVIGGGAAAAAGAAARRRRWPRCCCCAWRCRALSRSLAALTTIGPAYCVP